MPGTKTDNNLIVAVVGLGYVGLPLALSFAKKKVKVIGYDTDLEKISNLKKGIDLSGEIQKAEFEKGRINYVNNPNELKAANFIIAAIPTPVNKKDKPDMDLLKKASRTIGQNLEKGAIVVFESTVYPGVTEEICVPIIEKESGLKCGADWYVGYSPERINPGDKEHTIEKITKVVSGMDEKTLKKISEVYRIVCKAGVFEAPNIQTAEMAKVFENIQRDVNIALVNELSLICHRLNIETYEVLAAAGTKWNFLKFRPGLVGGHCVGVDPYYLLEKAKRIGYDPQVITAGRRINDYMPKFLAEELTRLLKETGKGDKKAKILIMGLTFKENVRDTRNSKIVDTIERLKQLGAKVFGYDLNLTSKEIAQEFEVSPVEKLDTEWALTKYDAVIINAPHKQFEELAPKISKIITKPKIVVDVSGVFCGAFKGKEDLIYKRL